jgi:3-oxoacyl-[acyl-carrier protein] reductase
LPKSWARNIRVNAINPGMVETEGLHAGGFAESDFRKQLEAQTPLGRIGRPQDIAPAAVFFASADAAWITGETLVIAGGLRRTHGRIGWADLESLGKVLR